MADQYPVNEQQKQRVILADNIINIVKYFKLGNHFINYISRDEHYYSHATKYGDYYLNVTGTMVPDYIIVTSKDELNAVINNDNYRMVIDLSNNS